MFQPRKKLKAEVEAPVVEVEVESKPVVSKTQEKSELEDSLLKAIGRTSCRVDHGQRSSAKRWCDDLEPKWNTKLRRRE